ncbi:MAG: hypothetical protein M0P71_16125 [Melioribacteraceae bacterium]|nr:hypothetical protein [Melioribacteraceae bacterium]
MITNFRLLWLIFFIPLLLSAETITSTLNGGRWEEASTWAEGTIPSTGSNVIVNGPVIVSTGNGYSCSNLTINSSGTLYNGVGYAWPDQVLIVNGDIVNSGIIRNEGRNGLVLNIKGDITNNGTWTFRRTELSGTSNQIISQGSGKYFESAFQVTDQTGQIIAGSAFAFTSWFDLNKCAFDLKNYPLTLKGESANISNGIVYNVNM